MSKKLYADLSELPSKISQLELDVDLTEDPKITTVTLYVTNWTNNAQTAIIPGIIANESEQAVWINPVYSSANIEAIGDCNVRGIAQGENSITFGCETVPTIDVQFYVRWEDIDYVDNSSGADMSEVIRSAEGIGF